MEALIENNSVASFDKLLSPNTANTSTLVVFDERVQDLEILYDALLPSVVGYTLDAHTDAIPAISQLLAETGATKLAILAHGEPGTVFLGKHPLNSQQLAANAHLLMEWGVKEIALYSCQVAQGNVGKQLIHQLSELTGAVVAASVTKTGCKELGGNWLLEVTTGESLESLAFDQPILDTYQAVLERFDPFTAFDAGINPIAVTLGDFNNDTFLDIATAKNLGNVSVLLNNGDGTFGAASFFSLNLGGNNPFAIATADFNNDGNQDLVTANRDNNNVSVLLGNGSGGFPLPPTNILTGFNPPIDVTVGDFNNDNIDDIATANNFGFVKVLLSNGDGTTFTDQGFSSLNIVFNNPSAIEVGDFNNDGNQDLVTANRNTNNVSVLLGNGIGGFASPNNISAGINPIDVAVGDFNNDNIDDIATANDFGNVSVLLGNGNGNFQAATSFSLGGNIPSAIEVGDFNYDNNLDIVTANNSSNNVSLLLGNGDGTFQTETNFSVANNPNSIAVGDLNGDTLSDVVTASDSQDNASVLLNDYPLDTPFFRIHDTARIGSYLFVAPPEAATLNPPRYSNDGLAFVAGASAGADPLLQPFTRYVDTAPGREGNYLFVAAPEAASIDVNNPNFVKQGIAFYAYFGGQGPNTLNFHRFITGSGAYFFAADPETNSILGGLPATPGTVAPNGFTYQGVAFAAAPESVL